ncbi:MAG: hypothetical protein IPH22_12415 [Nitrosomonas sp.]|nr:hypothetical protein [Nitrosomonas sp.]
MIKNYTNRSKSQLLEEIQRLHTELAAVNLMTEERTTALYMVHPASAYLLVRNAC